MTKRSVAVNYKTAEKLKQNLKPFVINGYYLIALDPSWSKVFDKVTFDVAIVKGRLQITSSQKINR